VVVVRKVPVTVTEETAEALEPEVPVPANTAW
jgi:hypothetical protein